MWIKPMQPLETNTLGFTSWTSIAQAPCLAFMALAAITDTFTRTCAANALGRESTCIADAKWTITTGCHVLYLYSRKTSNVCALG
jgi:hypothetical protein